MKTRKRKIEPSPRRRRRMPRSLLVALAVIVTGVVVTIFTSRRIRPLSDWADLFDDEVDPRQRARFPSTPVYLPGPAGELYVDDGGIGEVPVLFVHGLAGSADQWRAQLMHLRHERRALALDLRGHGRSEAPHEGAWEVADYADDVLAATDELGLERFVLAGHSLGASVVLEAARRRPEQVAGVLLVDPNGDQTRLPRAELDSFLRALAGDPRGEMRTHFRQLLLGSGPEVADQVLADLDRTPVEALRGSLESSFAYSPIDALREYPGPCLSIASDLNSLPISLHNLDATLPVRLLHGTGHWIQLDRPDEVNRICEDFLAAVE